MARRKTPARKAAPVEGEIIEGEIVEGEIVEEEDEYEEGVAVADDDFEDEYEDEYEEEEPEPAPPPKPKKRAKKRRTRKSKAAKVTRDTVADTDEVDWDGIMAQFAADGDVLFIKDSISVRCLPFADPTEIFAEVESYYNGRKSTKLLTSVWWLEAPPRKSPIRALLVTPSIAKRMLNIQKQPDYDLFDEDEAVGLMFIKTGSGRDSTTQINPGRLAKPMTDEIWDYYEEWDLEAVAEAFTAEQRRRNEENQNQGQQQQPSAPAVPAAW